MKEKNCKVGMQITDYGGCNGIFTILCFSEGGIIVQSFPDGRVFETEARDFRKLRAMEKPGYVDIDTRAILAREGESYAKMTECDACGSEDYEGMLRICHFCYLTKCSHCDKGEDNECLSCPTPA